MKRSIVETLIGAAVIAVAVYFFAFSYSTADVGSVDGYDLNAEFTTVGALKIGDAVKVGGVKVGTVKSLDLSPETYLARVTLSVDNAIKLPYDTAATISSESLLGGAALSLEPGADEEVLEAGDRIQFTQSPQSLEQLLGKFIFSVQNNKDSGETADNNAP